MKNLIRLVTKNNQLFGGLKYLVFYNTSYKLRVVMFYAELSLIH